MKNIFAIIFISISYTTLAMEKEIQLPNQETLLQQLKAEGLPEHAIKTAKIDTSFGDQTMSPVIIRSTVNKLFENVTKLPAAKGREEFVTKHLEEHRSKIYAVLLKEHPEILKQLQE